MENYVATVKHQSAFHHPECRSCIFCVVDCSDENNFCATIWQVRQSVRKNVRRQPEWQKQRLKGCEGMFLYIISVSHFQHFNSKTHKAVRNLDEWERVASESRLGHRRPWVLSTTWLKRVEGEKDSYQRQSEKKIHKDGIHRTRWNVVR